MKKIILISILIFAIAVLLPSCSKEDEESSLCICVDLAYVELSADDEIFKESFETNTLITYLVEAGRNNGVEVPREFEVEYIPASGAEREVALQRVRTEIMSGEGPDVFLLACDFKNHWEEEEALFIMPEKAMELAVFLPLDEYMENSTYFAEWDRMNQTVLAAGRNYEGQQIIPLCYTIPAAVYRAEDAEHTPSKEITWMDMLESENEALRAAAVWTDNYGVMGEGVPFMLSSAPMVEFTLGAIADYEEEELLFTKEELQQRMDEIIQLADQYRAGEYNSAPVHYNEYVGHMFDLPSSTTDISGEKYDVHNGIEQGEDYTLIPLYSDDGGVTAEISVYAAINRNTRQPEEAFRVLDFLASYSEQKSDWIYDQIIYQCGRVYNIPMYDELMQMDQRVKQRNTVTLSAGERGWYLSDESFAQLCAVREQITNVKFRSVLDQELRELYWSYYDAVRYDKSPDAVLEEGYRQIQRLIRE